MKNPKLDLFSVERWVWCIHGALKLLNGGIQDLWDERDVWGRNDAAVAAMALFGRIWYRFLWRQNCAPVDPGAETEAGDQDKGAKSGLGNRA